MGTDYGAALAEARRVLKSGGTLLIAEVASRFEGIPRDDFVEAVERIGFRYSKGHPFLHIAKNDGSARGGSSASRKGKGRRKKRGGNGGGGGGNGASKRGSDFFSHFAFDTVDNKCVDWKEAGLPSLKPCIYKRRWLLVQ